MPPRNEEKRPLLSSANGKNSQSVKVSQSNFSSANYASNRAQEHRIGYQGNENHPHDDKLAKPGEPASANSRPRRILSKGVDPLLWSITIDVAIAFILWLTGANSEHFVEESISDFHFRSSVFDLALLGAFKSGIVFPLVAAAEKSAIKAVTIYGDDSDAERAFRGAPSQRNGFFYGVVVSGVAAEVFVIVKSVFVLDATINDASYVQMSDEWKTALIWSVIQSSIQLVLIGLLRSRLRMLQQQQKEQLLREKEEEDAGNRGSKPPTPPKPKASLRRLLALAKPEVGLILVGMIFLIGSAAAQMVSPLFFGRVVDASMSSMDELTQTALTLFGIYTGSNVCTFFRTWIFTLAGERFVARIRKRTFISIINQDVGFFDETKTGELTNRLASDTQLIQNAVTVNISMLVRYALQIIGSLALMFSLSAPLTGVLLAVVPIVSLGTVFYGRFLRKLRKAYQDKLAEAGATAEESISQVRTVRAFSAENRICDNYGGDIDVTYGLGKKLALLSGVFQGIVGTLAFGAITLVLWYGGKLVFEKKLTAGILTSFLMYTLTVAMAFAFLAGLYGDFMQAVGASVRIFELMDKRPEIPVTGGNKDDGIKGGIVFDKVSFSYPTRKETRVLTDVSFSIEPGQVVALVGPSGGGKSTVVQLIEKFYTPDEGTIKIGGQPLLNLDPQWLRRAVMSIVAQEPTLFCGSIRDNIAFGRRTATQEEIEEAARQANAFDFIQTFDDKFDTLVGERGVRLSGGQKQRIAIARALIMNPKVLLLDEATSALDAESEHLVQEAIDRAIKAGQRTVLVIAHRLSTVRNANLVVVIQNGRVAETGSHETLMALDGVYKKLVQRQLAAGDAEEEEEEEVEEEEGEEEQERDAGGARGGGGGRDSEEEEEEAMGSKGVEEKDAVSGGDVYVKIEDEKETDALV